MLKIFLVWVLFLGFAVTEASLGVREAPSSWHLYFEDSLAKLAYGTPNSDNVGLMLTCEARSGAVRVYSDAEPGRPTLVLASGRKSTRLQGVVYPDPLSGGTAFETETSSHAAAFQNFARTGRLSVIDAAHARPIPASAEDKREVRRFFAYCT